VVGPRADSAVRRFALRDVNWLIAPPDAPLRVQVQLRAREPVRDAVVDGTEVELDEPALPAPGQACVFYDGSRILGGGFIRRG